MDNEIRTVRLNESLKIIKSKISLSPNESERNVLYKVLNTLQAEANTLESGISIVETQKGRYVISREHEVDCAQNRKLKRLSI